MFNDKVSAMLVVDGFAEARLELLGHVEIVEDGYRSVVEFDDILLLGCYQPKVVLDFFTDRAVVDVYAVISGVEQITEQSNGAALLLKA